MSHKVSYLALGLVLAGLAIFGLVQTLQFVTTEHDGWDTFSPVSVTTEPLVVDPRNLLSPDHRDEIASIVNEARTYGIPWSIRVIRPAQDATDLDAQELSEERYAEAPVETAEGADDGLLMLVAVPADDHSASQTAFATGSNFYPHGGITPDQLQWIVDVQMAQAIEEGRVGDAVIEGATWVEWTHLFETTPDVAQSPLERGLQGLLEPFGAIGFAGLAMLVLAAMAAVLLITRRGTDAAPVPTELDSVTAAAIERGRVDRPVIAGAILDAIDRGVLALSADGKVTAGPLRAASDRDRIVAETVGDRSLSLAALIRAVGRDGELARQMEDELAASGALHPKSPKLTISLRWITIAGTVLGALAIVVSVLGSSRYALGAALALTAISLVAALWNERRSWATRAGGHMVTAWRDLHQDAADQQRAIFETIVCMEPLTATRDRSAPISPGALPLLPDVH